MSNNDILSLVETKKKKKIPPNWTYVIKLMFFFEFCRQRTSIFVKLFYPPEMSQI